MELFVIKSDFEDENNFYVVDEKNMLDKTKLIDDYPEYERLDEENEKRALIVYHKGGDDTWNVIAGTENDFYRALISEK